jgi:5-formyltetrahydrofolate cyclo-ligase
MNVDSLYKLGRMIAKSELCILYKSMNAEVYIATLPFELPKASVTVPVDYTIDPKKIAQKIVKKFNGKKVVIFIPGKKFDIHGGRHGKGKGWYDRFLSVVPRQWTRIGVCLTDQFSNSKLTLQEWDELMDWVIVKNGENFSCHEIPSKTFL